MKSHGMLVLLVFSLVFLCPEGAMPQEQERLPDFCQPRKIELEIHRHVGLEVISHYFHLWPSFLGPHPIGEITLRNNTGELVESIFLLVSYFDDSGHYIFSILYYAGVEGKDYLIGSIRPFYEGTLDKPVPPGELIHLMGTNLLVPTVLPRSAQVAYVLMYTPNGCADHSWGVPWRTEPMLAETPESFDLDVELERLPEEVFVRARIDAKGRVVQLEDVSTPRVPEQVFEQMKMPMTRWRFIPAIRDGFAEAEQLNIRVRFHPETVIPIRECSFDARSLPRLFAMVDFLRAKGQKGRWIPYYGGYPARGPFQSQRYGPPIPGRSR